MLSYAVCYFLLFNNCLENIRTDLPQNQKVNSSTHIDSKKVVSSTYTSRCPVSFLFISVVLYHSLIYFNCTGIILLFICCTGIILLLICCTGIILLFICCTGIILLFICCTSIILYLFQLRIKDPALIDNVTLAKLEVRLCI